MTYEWHVSTYEWHMDDIQVHTSGIRVTHGWHTNRYKWHTSTCEWHTDDMRVHTSDIQVTYGQKEKKLTFLEPLDNPLSKKELLACNSCSGLFTKIKKGSGTSFWRTFSVQFFHVSYLILYQLTKFQWHIFFSFLRYQTKRAVKFLFKQLMTS